MQLKGKIKDICKDLITSKWVVSFLVDECNLYEFNALVDKDLSIEAKPYREKRSLNANRLLWECIGKIATALRTDKWQVYLTLIKRYGKFTYICVKPNVVEDVKSQWRECEEIGHVNINGTDSVQLLCYFGSHTYNSKEFSVLLDGTMYEMEQLGISTPAQEDLERSLELWEKQKNGD